MNPRYPDGEPPKVTSHKQPRATIGAMEKIDQLPRRVVDTDDGYDGLGIILLDCVNDGVTPVTLSASPKVPANYVYDRMIVRMANEYDTRFRTI